MSFVVLFFLCDYKLVNYVATTTDFRLLSSCRSDQSCCLVICLFVCLFVERLIYSMSERQSCIRNRNLNFVFCCRGDLNVFHFILFLAVASHLSHGGRCRCFYFTSFIISGSFYFFCYFFQYRVVRFCTTNAPPHNAVHPHNFFVSFPRLVPSVTLIRFLGKIFRRSTHLSPVFSVSFFDDWTIEIYVSV